MHTVETIRLAYSKKIPPNKNVKKQTMPLVLCKISPLNMQNKTKTVAKTCYRVVKNAKKLAYGGNSQTCIREKQYSHNNSKNTNNTFCFTQNFALEHAK